MTPPLSVPDTKLFQQLPWLRDVSVWSAPPTIDGLADTQDSFLLGGDGYLSARLGLGERVSTMERIMAPYLSSYNFAENVNFRKDQISPSRDFYPPLVWQPTASGVWRVRNSGIIITAENTDELQLATVSFVHPGLHAYLRFVTLRNIGSATIRDIGISAEAVPDIPYPIAGHRSRINPTGRGYLIEELEELEPIDRDYSPNYSTRIQRHRYLLRGMAGAKVRGLQDLFIHTNELHAGEELSTIHYLIPSLHDSEAGLSEQAAKLDTLLQADGGIQLLVEVRSSWQAACQGSAQFEASNRYYEELITNNLIVQKQIERATGGFVVIDDYTGSWLRDHNGSHRFLLALGNHEAVHKSMDRYYGLDVSGRSLYSVYASDLEPLHPFPAEPDWKDVVGFITGDVPNYRTLWYRWYFEHTGDLELIRSRFNHLKGAFDRQQLHKHGFLAEYCFDETYGIGPIGPMRTGLSFDNSVNALAAADALAEFAQLLGRDDAEELRLAVDCIRDAIEQQFWIEDAGYYGMRIRPDGTLDDTPLSVALLRPLWLNVRLNPTRVASSACYAFDKLYQDNSFLRLIPSHHQTITMAIGYLLVAMKRMLHPGLERVFSDMLRWCDPSGTFGEYLDDTPDGPHQCYEHMAHRNRMWESGINSEACLYALAGFEPKAHNNALALAPYLPSGWSHFSFKDFRIGHHRLSMDYSKSGTGFELLIETDSDIPLQLSLQLRGESPSPILNHGTHVAHHWQHSPFGILYTDLLLPISRNSPIHISH